MRDKLKREKLTMIELFSGIGSQIRGTENTGLWDCSVVNTAEINKEAMVSYAAVHCGLTPEMIETYDAYPSREEMAKYLADRNIGYDFKQKKPFDWYKLAKRKTTELNKYYLACKLTGNLGDISAIKGLNYADLWTYSFPCFVEGTLVLTDKGYKPIEYITAADYVLTHTNEYRKVVKPMVNRADELYRVSTMVSEPLYTTAEHPFYVRKKVSYSDTNKHTRTFGEPEWVKAKDLTKDYYVGTAINQNAELPFYDADIGVFVQLSNYFDTTDFWYLIGRYMGDGWIRDTDAIVISSGRDSLDALMRPIKHLGLSNSIKYAGTLVNVYLNVSEIGTYCDQFGRGLLNKRLTEDVLNLPVSLQRAFLRGYLDAVGCYRQGHYEVESASRELLYGVGQCIAKSYKVPFSIYKEKKSNVDMYNLVFKRRVLKTDKAFYEDGYIWSPIWKVGTEQYHGFVYNLEVETDNSYVVQNVIVHNCQDLSVAGLQRGLVKGETRSGLLYEVGRLLEVAKTEGSLPKYLLLENVKNLVSAKFKPQFEDWVAYLESLGYNTYWKVLNSKECGIPQNRERTFAISIRKDLDTGTFVFPKPFELTLRLCDLLEPKVDEIYFLSEKVQARFKLTDETFTKQIIGTTAPDCRQIGQRDRVYSKEGIMGSLMHTDYKQPKQIIDNQEECQRYLENLSDSCNFVKKGAQGIIDKLGRLPEMFNAYNQTEITDVAPTLTTQCHSSTASGTCLKCEPNYRIRKLTPTECWRLMGFETADIVKARQMGTSDTSLYEQAGNSIVTNCIALIMEHLYKAQVDTTYVCFDEQVNSVNFTQPQKVASLN